MPENEIRLSNAELNRLLEQAAKYGQAGQYGPTVVDMWRNYNAQKGALNGLSVGTDMSQEMYDDASSAIKSGKWNTAITGGLTALNGLSSILGTATNLAGINDTSIQRGQVADIASIGSGNFGSYNQLDDEYRRLSGVRTSFDYDDIRGKSTGQKFGGVFSSTLSGATTGASIGGPWGALAGGLVGLGAGVAGWLSGDQSAKAEQGLLETTARQNLSMANRNLGAAHERLANYNFRSGVANRAALGGRMEMESEALTDFADRVLSKRKTRPAGQVHSGIIRQHCDGGTMIRIKR